MRKHQFMPSGRWPDESICLASDYGEHSTGTCGKSLDDPTHFSNPGWHPFKKDIDGWAGCDYRYPKDGDRCGGNADDPEHECPHDNIEREPADPAVGIRNEGIWCEDCGKDLSDDPAFEYDYDGDQADLYDPTDV